NPGAAPSEANGQLVGAGAAGTNTVGVLRGGYGVVLTNGTPTAFGLITQTSNTVGVRLLDEANEYAIDAAINQATQQNALVQTAATLTNAGPVNSLYVRNGAPVNAT